MPRLVISPAYRIPPARLFTTFTSMIVLRLLLGLAALGLLHSVLFAPVPAGARERARRDRR